MEADGSDDDFHKRNLLQLGVSQISSCSGMSQTLSEGCSIGDDCSTITCDMNFVETPIVIGTVINDSSNSSESYMKELQKLRVQRK